MKRLRLSVLAGLALGSLVLPVLGAPPVLDRVPDDAMFVLLVPSPETLQKNISALSTAVEYPLPMPPVKDILAMGGITGGVDTSKAIAVVVLPPPKGGMPKVGGDAPNELEQALDAPEELAVALFPVTNYAEFLNNFGVKPAGDGKVDTVEMGAGQTGYVKDVGGNYIALSDKKDLIERFAGKAGAAPVKGKLGKAGESLADSSDIAVVVNMDAVRPHVPDAVTEMKRKAKEQAGAMGAAPAQVEAQMQAMTWLVETAARDARAVVGGLKFSALGIGLDSVTNFNEGSYLAKTFASGGSPTALLTRIPGGKFMFAGAVDTSIPGFKQFLVDMVTKAGIPTPEGSKAVATFLADADGHSGVIAFPEGGFTAGLLSSAAMFTKSKNPDATVAALRKTMQAMDGQVENGMTCKTAYIENGAKIDDTPVDVWEIKFVGQGDANQMVGMATTFLFGPQGEPAGYVIKTKDGVYRTATKNPELARRIIAGGDNLGGDKLIAQVGEQLPKGRIAEGYIGPRPVVDLAAYFVSMMGIPVPMDKVPERLPPIGVALSSDSGAARMSLFVPAPVIKTGAFLGTFMSEQMDGMGMEEDEDPGQDDKKGTGQPKF